MNTNVVFKLDLVEQKLRELNFDKIANELKKIKLSYISLKEIHNVPSVEKMYEDSKSLGDFSKDLRKMIEILERYLNKLKNFEVEYNRILNKVLSKQLSEEEAIVEIVDKVTEVDEFFDNELKKIK